VATFIYDGISRRQSITHGATIVADLYDGFDPLQEQSGGLVLANLLPRLMIDERFTRPEGSATAT
jgi:hypothetical protein